MSPFGYRGPSHRIRATGRLEASFANNPQLPFSELRLTLNGGEHAPLANPLTCAPAAASYEFTPFTALPGPGGIAGGGPATGSTPFQRAAARPRPPFSLSQTTADSSNKAAAYTHYTFNLARAEGQQYLQSSRRRSRPASSARFRRSRCVENRRPRGRHLPVEQPDRHRDASPSGAGDPYAFSGPVYLTGLTTARPTASRSRFEAKAGPFDLGRS